MFVFTGGSVVLVFLTLSLTTQEALAQAIFGQVSGQITDADTGLPLAAANLTFTAQSTFYSVTLANGTYTACLPWNSYTLQIAKDGYANHSLNNVQVNSANVTLLQNAALSSNTVYPWPFIVPPTGFRTLQDKVRFFTPAVPSYGQYWPDGKMLAFRSDPKNKTSPFIFSINPDYRMTASNSFFYNVTGSAGGSTKDYPTKAAKQHGNFITLPNNVPIPPPNVTGMRGNGMNYDYNDIWLFNAFRLSETSNSSADPNEMIGFVHNEDYWGWGGAVNGCIYKSIGVRYSNDLGKSWTRSVPILTKGIQAASIADCMTRSPKAGTGDMAAMWNPIKSQWVILGQESNFGRYAPSPSLVMSVSSDPLARPGTWTRINPVTNQTDPGLIGTNRTLLHGDLTAIFGASPSIIRDSLNKVWHMVYAPWGGGLAYTNSTDLTRWQRPIKLPLTNAGYGYPTLIGDEGDTLTTTGKVWLWYKGTGYANGYNIMMGAQLHFGNRTL